MMTFREAFSVPAADVDGSTGQAMGQFGSFEGYTAYDLDDILDRDEEGDLLWASHRIVAYITSTQTADGTIRGSLEVSASPTRSVIDGFSAAGWSDIQEPQFGGFTDFTVEQDDMLTDDTTDLLGMPLVAVGYGPITDGTNGVGGAGTAGTDEWAGPVPSPTAQGWDPRDEVYINGLIGHSNVDDAALHLDVWGQHVYRVRERR